MNYGVNINEHEYLFWKVIHNKYLFNLIFEKIHEISNEIEQTHNIKSYKFKDIKSVTWMIHNGIFNILKYKLSNNEEIKIEDDCVSIMFRFIIDKTPNKYGWKYYYSKEGQIEIDKIKESIFEILSLLLKNYRSGILKYDLIQIVLDKTFENHEFQPLSLELIRILVNEPHSIAITPKHFKLVILNYNVEYIKEFVEIANQSNCNIVDQDFKEQSLLIVLNKVNENGKPSIDQEVLKFILDNPQYHCEIHDPYTPTERLFYRSPRKDKRSCMDTRVKHDTSKRDMVNFKLLNQELQIKLLSLKFFNTYKWNQFETTIAKLIMANKHNDNNESILKERKRRDDVNQFIYDINNNTDMDKLSKIKSINEFFSNL